MPAKKNDIWYEVQTPSTPAQINHFFELCSKWLIEEVSDDEDATIKKTNYFMPSKNIYSDTLGIDIPQVQYQYINTCFFCKKSSKVRPVLGNPFARQQFVLVCTNCFED